MSRKTQENSNQPSSNTTRDAGSASARRTKQKSVPDDWDAEESDDDDDNIANEILWKKANTSAPMPEVVISGSSTTPSIVSPPPEALQGPLRILKRPSHGSSQGQVPLGSGQGASAGQRSIVDREAEYQAARARIFSGKAQAAVGTSGTSSIGGGTAASTIPHASTGTASTSSSSSSSSSNAIRNPHGPATSSTGENARGFVTRPQGGKHRSAGSSSSSLNVNNPGSSNSNSNTG